MGRKVVCFLTIVAILFGISTPIYGKETELMVQGNITGIQEQVKNIETDYRYLENEISNLTRGNAGNQNRKEQIISKGNFYFQDGKVHITASDFIYLADEIDGLESIYKCNLVEALNGIGTYFKADGSVTYDSSQNETSSEEEKTKLALKDIKQGILKSQSVESLAQTQATDKDGNLLYYVKEDKNVFELTTNNTGYPLFYQAVTADNLSAGTSAWVNGVLIKGNGADNVSYRERGYKEGYTKGYEEGKVKGNEEGYHKGMTECMAKARIQYTYHIHKGNASAIGGCYGNCTGYTSVGCSCWGWVGGSYGCDNCHHALVMHGDGYCTGIVNNEAYTYIGLVCGKTTDTIESATIVY